MIFGLIFYADDILLINSYLSTLHANLNSLISGYEHLRHNVNASKTEFQTYNARGKAISSLSVIVAGKSIIESSLLQNLTG